MSLPSDAEIEAAAQVLDRLGRFYGWWRKSLPTYEEMKVDDPIGASEFGGFVQEILMAAAKVRP